MTPFQRVLHKIRNGSRTKDWRPLIWPSRCESFWGHEQSELVHYFVDYLKDVC